MSRPLYGSSQDDPDFIEPFRLNSPRLRRGRLTPTSSLKLQALSAYPTLYREVNLTEAAESPADPPSNHNSVRVLNVIVATIGIIIAAPLMLFIAIAIKLTSRGPAFYAQTRVGLDRRWREGIRIHEARAVDLGGRPFTMYKFRTMVIDAEADGKAVWASKDDPRITAVGQFLRRARLDELPQLFNVLRGDMNIVGPRPERPSIFLELRNEIPSYHLRQRVMPGITGWAQVNQRYDTYVDDVRRKVDFDLEYVRLRSVTTDISIMVRTIPVMVRSDFGR
jgi:lipopolysaccharide/colanic/teichoic acid biosynthesis glycosyltransferase